MQRLAEGQPFPPIEGPVLDGGSIRFPDDVSGEWTILLFYRGHW